MGQHLVANLIRPAVTVFLFLGSAIVVFIFLIVELRNELALGLNVSPAVGVEDRSIHGIVKFTKPWNFRTFTVRIMKPVVDGRHSHAMPPHQIGAELVIDSAILYEFVSVTGSWPWECLEAVSRSVSEIIFHRGSLQPPQALLNP